MSKLIIFVTLVIILLESGESLGEDEMYLTCSRPSTKNSLRSARFLKLQERWIKKIPCDLRTQNYCNLPGDFYPITAVGRFIKDHNGLMRRMYGEVRQKSVLRMEEDFQKTNALLTNEITEENISYESISISNKGASLEDIRTNTTTSNETIVEEVTMATTLQQQNDEETMATETIQTTEPFTNVFFADAEKIEKRNSMENNKPVSSESEEKPKPVLKAVNACPVKEEVVAPYWANNTRGEILALVNYYPFEQYIHFEKCDHEMKQMFCRRGCRCEQQYRLHRLLAFDPTNECRGIFSDWFRFPSCCICKCYLTEEEIFSHYRSEDQLPSNNRSPRKFFSNSEEEFENDEDFDQPDVDGVVLNDFYYNGGNRVNMLPR